MPLPRPFRRTAAALVSAGLLVVASAAGAAAQTVTTFNSRSAFSAAAGLGGIAPGAANTFESFCEPGSVLPGPIPTVCTLVPTFTTVFGNGLDVVYTGPATGGFYFAQPGGVYQTTGRLNPPPQSVVLTTTVGSNQQFSIRRGSGLAPDQLFAVGFDVYTNGGPTAFTPPQIQVFGIDGSLLGEFAVGAARNTLGFFGVQASVPIGRLEYTAIDGALFNTAIDNLDFGTTPAAVPPANVVPEPATVALAGAWLLALAAAARRRRTAGAA